MSKIYEALRRAEQDQGSEPAVARLRIEPRNRSFRQKMIALYQTIESRLPDKRSRVVMFVGARCGEGTSTLARELAKLATAELAQRAVLLDLTFGTGGHYEHFGVALKSGLNDVTAQRVALQEACQPVSEKASLSLACAATGECSASVVIASATFSEIISELRQSFSLILIDAPPLCDSSDALLAVPETDGVVMIVESEATRWQVAENAREKLVMQGANVLGIVLNRRKFYIPSFIYRRL